MKRNYVNGFNLRSEKFYCEKSFLIFCGTYVVLETVAFAGGCLFECAILVPSDMRCARKMILAFILHRALLVIFIMRYARKENLASS